MNDNALALIAVTSAAFTAMVFIRAAWHKLADFRAFVGFVSDYRLLPAQLVETASATLLVVEITIAVTLLIPGVRPLGAVLAIVLLGLYAAAIGITIARGRTSVECGCGGAPNLLSSVLLVRNGVLALVAAGTFIGDSVTLEGAGAATAIATAFLLFVLFLLVEQILANGMHVRQIRSSSGGKP